MQLIVAVDENWGIGRGNDLLFSLKEDMKFFRQTTLDKTVVMGYNTLMSFPNSKPLPKRKNIVLTTKKVELYDNLKAVSSLEELSKTLREEEEEKVFIIGGAKFYKTMLPYCKTAFVTKVKANGNAEVFFENLDENKNWVLESKSEDIIDGEYVINFCVYKNKNVIEF